jgi:Regulator of chromosome condensation (RCC1) repeat
MSIDTRFGVRFLVFGALLVAGFAGCSGSAPTRPTGGGTGGTGGAIGSGGSAGGDTGGSSGLGTGGMIGPGTGGMIGPGTGGRIGSGGATGTGGMAASGGSTGTGGSGAGGASMATGGSGGGGFSCGALGQTCCASGDSCGADLACLGSASCSCIRDLFDWYLLRADRKLLFEADPPVTDQTPVLDAATALPLADVALAVGGNNYGCAVQGASGNSWCWRTAAAGNNVGQLGSGTMEASGALFRATQVLIATNQPLTGVTQLFTNHLSGIPATCAIVTGGQVYCWGALTWLANQGTTTNSPYATRITLDGIAPLTGATHMAFGTYTACAVVQGTSAKEVWCWGNNTGGQLGQGDVVARRYPTKVVGIAAPTRVAVADSNAAEAMVCAVDGDRVSCWGGNAVGYTGTGSSAQRVLAPTQVLKMDGVTPLSGIADIRAVGRYNYGGFCALTPGLIPVCWGDGFGRAYPDVYVAPNLVSLGHVNSGTFGATVRYLSSDGVYHVGTGTRTPNCGPLQ